MLFLLAAAAVLFGLQIPLPHFFGAIPSDLLAGAAVVALMVCPATDEPRRRVDPVALLAVGGYVGWAALSAAGHRCGYARVVGVADLAGLLWMAAAYARRELILRALVAGAALACLVGLLGSVLMLLGHLTPLSSLRGGDLGLPWRPKGLCVTTNALAALALVPTLLVFRDCTLTGRWRRPLQVLFAVTFACSLSRSLLALALGLLLSSQVKRTWKGIGVATLLLFAFLSVRLDLYRDARGLVVATTPSLRVRMNTAAWHSLVQHPWLGTGPGSLTAPVHAPRPTDDLTPMSAHLTWLDVAATLGLPALLAFGLIWVRALSASPRDEIDRLLLIGLYAILFDSLTVDVENFRHLWLLLGLRLRKSLLFCCRWRWAGLAGS